MKRWPEGAAGRRGHDTEYKQSLVRFVLAPIIACYLLLGIWSGAIPGGVGELLSVYIFAYLASAALLHVWIARRSGRNHLRRAVAMALDYGSITLVMVVGGEFTTPVFATLLWMTVGYGMRYGQLYLAIGTTLALGNLLLLSIFSAYWSQHPYLLATLAITTMIVPAYAFILLKDVRIARDAALAASRANSRFLAQASHDLRQPIHAISLFTACLRDSGLVSDQAKMVENIDRSLNSVSRLFRSLLDISTLDSGKVRPQLEAISVRALLREVKDQNGEIARSAGARVRVVPSDLNFVGDPTLMTTILQNIVSNALKYAPGSDIVIGCRRCGNGAFAIWVCDAGPGIAYGEQGRVFEEFYRSVRPGSDVEGVGLGLPIVRRMATLMGFGVRLRSVPGRGTTVAIEGIASTGIAPVSTRPRRTSSTPLTGMRILLIEDDADVLLATKMLLERWECAVQAMSSLGDEPIPCDLIIADYDLNGPLTGIECIQRLRAHFDAAIPAIVMTGHEVTRIEEILDDPDIPLLPKPVRPSDLRAALMNYRLKLSKPV